MKLMKKEDKLQDDYIGQKTAEILAIDYDENQLFVAEVSNKVRHYRKGISLDVK